MKQMKRKIAGFIVGALILVSPTYVLAEKNPIKLRVDGWVLYTDVAPQIVEGRALVPLRVISEQLGATVQWEAKLKKVTIKDDAHSIQLVIGERKAFHSNKEITLDAAPQIKNGRTLIPVRFVSEALGQSIQWDTPNRTVVIDSMMTPKLEIANKENLAAERKKVIAKDPKAPQGQELLKENFVAFSHTTYVFPIGKISMYASISQDVITFVQNGTIIGQQRFKDKTIVEQWGKVFNIQDHAVFFNNYIFGERTGLMYGTIDNGEFKEIDTLRNPNPLAYERIIRIEEEENLIK